MSDQRIRFLTIILGTNGTGKSTFIKKLISKLDEQGERTLIITPDENEFTSLKEWKLEDPKEFDFKGVRKHIFTDKKVFENIGNNYRRGALVLDDCKVYMPTNLESLPVFRDLLIRRRQKEVDVFVIAHSFNQIPPVLFSFVNKFVLFKTSGPSQDRKKHIDNYDLVEAAINRVNAQNLKVVDTFGDGKISAYEIIDV